jgi:glycosyltransferase involved in cell wall biosynthesis
MKILAVLPAVMPSTTILVIEPLLYLFDLGKIELRVRLEALDVRLSDLEWADLIIFCRNTEPAYDMVENLLALGKPYVYELDDNFFELTPDTSRSKYHRAPERIAQLEKYLKHAMLVRVYSAPLEARVRQVASNVKLVKAPAILYSIPAMPPQRRSKKLKILFSTSRTVSDNLSQIFIKDLTRVLQEYPDNLEVHFRGFLPEELRAFPSVKFHRFISNYQKYLQKTYEESYDIGLAPMIDDLSHNSKTNNKFREYGACWIAGIYSNAELYASCVEDGKTGLLVSSEEGAWYTAMIKLMKDAELRQSIQKQARTVVEQEYSLDAYAELLLADIKRILQSSAKYLAAKSFHETRRVTSADHPGRRSIFTRTIGILANALIKLYRSIREHGLVLTIRLILEQIERYVAYFNLSRRIARK